MKTLTTNEDVYALLDAPAASAALGSATVLGPFDLPAMSYS